MKRPGNVVVIAGRNSKKIDYILGSVNAGLHVLADKPWIVRSADLPRLEQAIWAESERETGEGIACNIGADGCIRGRKAKMTEVRPSPADERRRREIFVSTVLARWVQRCGPTCADVWNQTIGPVSGFEAAK